MNRRYDPTAHERRSRREKWMVAFWSGAWWCFLMAAMFVALLYVAATAPTLQ